MTREQEFLFITKVPTRYRDLNPGPLVAQSGPQTTRPVGNQNKYLMYITKCIINNTF
jgi:hypothetical protein